MRDDDADLIEGRKKKEHKDSRRSRQARANCRCAMTLRERSIPIRLRWDQRECSRARAFTMERSASALGKVGDGWSLREQEVLSTAGGHTAPGAEILQQHEESSAIDEATTRASDFHGRTPTRIGFDKLGL